MKIVIIFVSLILLFVVGCVQNEPMPQICSIDKSPVFTPPPVVVKPSPPGYTPYPGGWVPSSAVEKSWTAIVIHHSATPNGNEAVIDRWHKGNGWDGIGYDFVINNGSDSPDGLVEVTFRWEQQRTGAHVGGTLGNWANKDAIGICLVGDFNKTVPTSRQTAELTKLVRFLQKRYGIPTSRIYGHGTTPGAKVTDCPGRNFPMAKFKSQL
ncbi:MAG: peptidoglycan recognition family protein [Phycisphaerae bacterium]|nr:peptidoglycan recognition family protein [Phycisphaerae bacterium]